MTFSNDTLSGFFHNRALEYGEAFPFLLGKFDNEGRKTDDYRPMTWKQVRDDVIDLARGLIALGLQKEDKAAIFSESRPRWIIADQAIQACGAIQVPLYATLSQDELDYMVNDSEARIIIVSTQDKAEMARRVQKEGRPLKTIIAMEPWSGNKPDGGYAFNEVMDLGRRQVTVEDVEKRIHQLAPDDIASIIYTSGTTGRPKGALITQANWVTNMHQASNSTMMKRQAGLNNHLLHLVHLPLCHVYGRTSDYHVGGLKQGGILAFEGDFGQVGNALAELKPNVVISVPRFFEKVYETIHSIVSRQKGPMQSLFKWAVRQGEKFTANMAQGRAMNVLDLLQFSLANILVFNRIKKMSGMDRLVLAGSGGGKLSKEICTFFRSLGIQLTEGYGLTETTPVINFNEPEFRNLDMNSLSKFQDKMIDWTVDLMVTEQAKGRSPYSSPVRSLKLMVAYYAVAYRLQIKPGSVGKPVKWTEEKIAEDGEIMVKGPQVFKGYWKLPEATQKAFSADGWFLTGDIGYFDEDGFLHITDRKKEIFVTSGGKNVAPHPIELAFTVKPYIDQACLVGDGEKYLAALIVPNYEELQRYADLNNISIDSKEDMLAKEPIQHMMKQQIDEVNAELARYEQIKYYHLLKEPFSVETGELTPTLKKKRRVITEKYKEEIAGMFQA